MVLFDLFVLDLILRIVFFRNFFDYEKIEVVAQILKRHNLIPPPSKRRSEVFCSEIDLRVAP